MKIRMLTTLAAASFILAGCASKDPMDVSYRGIVHNLSPEVTGSVERPVDVNRHMNLTSDMNSRLFWDDLGRLWYTDHPSKLSPFPITGTSGMPR